MNSDNINLRPYTIVPKEFYVVREADRQLRAIISDMGRPGYVLVSRQMGKTNLLLNAKRELESLENIYVYLDLSIVYESEKGCFENIINTIIDTNHGLFQGVSEKIYENRKLKNDEEPSRQHLAELRILLSCVKTRLVIILDEIDALTKTKYSDKIFAQIRSSYFIRVNYPELSKLTYILSGVVEPTEIIKDPKISPFNIGQKIYLNDFSKNEFSEFVEKANLSNKINSEILDRIYYWTRGNPRMTWDVCSEVEKKINTEKSLTKEFLDTIIQNLYLRKHDSPPIDHIRDLARSDKEIRAALIEIAYKNEDKITDRIKNKLYLAGIINYEEDTIHLKNPVIEQSLNYEWIMHVEEEEKGILKLALEAYERQTYEIALDYFVKYYDENPSTDEESAYNYYCMAYCATVLKKYNKAQEFLTKSVFNKDNFPDFFRNNLLLRAVCNYHLNNISECINDNKEVITNSKNHDFIYFTAQMNIGNALRRLGGHAEESKQLYEALIKEIKSSSSMEPEKNKEKISAALYNYGYLELDLKNLNKANELFSEALDYASTKNKPSIYLALIKCEQNRLLQIDLLKNAIETIINNNLDLAISLPSTPLNYNKEFIESLIVEAFNLDYKLATLLIEYCIKNYWTDKAAEIIISEIAIPAYNEGQTIAARLLCKFLIEKIKKGELPYDEEVLSTSQKYLALISLGETDSKELKEYVEIFEQKSRNTIDIIDFQIFSFLIDRLISAKRIPEAERYIEIINRFKNERHKPLLPFFLIITNHEMIVSRAKGDNSKALLSAKEILQIVENSSNNPSHLSNLNKKDVEFVRQNAINTINALTKKSPIVSIKNPGRNDLVRFQYKNGEVVLKKHKYAKKDQDQGLGEILFNFDKLK